MFMNNLVAITFGNPKGRHQRAVRHVQKRLQLIGTAAFKYIEPKQRHVIFLPVSGREDLVSLRSRAVTLRTRIVMHVVIFEAERADR
jgi:hypothetical protein